VAQLEHLGEQLTERGLVPAAELRDRRVIRTRIAVISLYTTSSRHSRSIPRDDLFPRAYAYNSSATTIDGSYAARP